MLILDRNLDCIDIFVKALRDPEKVVRSQATRALADIGKPATERLISLLKDPNWKVHYRAAKALELMKELETTKPLIERLSDEKDHVRYMAVKCLGNICPNKAIEYIEPLLNDENPYVRRMADSVIRKRVGSHSEVY